MEADLIRSIFSHFENPTSDFRFQLLKAGHINQTYRIYNRDRSYILQKMNTQIFQNLDVISRNIQVVSYHLTKNNYPHKILEPLLFDNGKFLLNNEWRLFSYIPKTQTIETVTSTQQAFRAAQFLSEFHWYLQQLEISQIQDSIPGFLDVEKRIEQFEISLKNASTERLQNTENEIDFIQNNFYLIADWLHIQNQIPQRVIHGDPKISNFLFDENDDHQIVSIIDWDTIMKGNILYDFGDMVRSYTNLKAEDNPEIGNNFSEENYHALKEGFLFYLKKSLTSKELENLDLAGKVVILVQAIRFLTDYLSGDQYYTIHYPEQNLCRTKNQLNLLKDLMRKIN